MDYTSARAMVALLFEHDPEKAQDLLAQQCRDNDKVREQVHYSISQLGSLRHQPRPTGRGSFGSSGPPSIHESHHSGSNVLQQEILPRPSPAYPPTPARTARSEVSHTAEDDASNKEYIYILNPLGDRVEQKLVQMKTVQITNSVIRYNLVPRNELGANTASTVEGEVKIPLHADTGTFRAVPFVCIVKLTWRRLSSEKTHHTDFYVVSDKMLDSDIILSYADSGVVSPSTNGPPPHSTELRPFQGYNQPSGPTPFPASYHLSAETNNDLSRPMSAQYQTRQNNQHFRNLVIPEAMDFAPSMENRYSQQMPSHTFHESQRTQLDISQPNPRHATAATVASTSAVSESQPYIPPDKLRVAIKWDETRFKLWLHPDEPGQAFFDAFRSQPGVRNRIWDRATTSILLKKDEKASDEITNTIYLDEDSLDVDWKEIVNWIGKNKKNESPHIFGTVYVDDK